MKIKYISSLLVFTCLLFFSCKKELNPQDSASASSNQETESTPSSPENTALTPSTDVNTVASQPITAQNSTVNSAEAKTLPGMNPPHGQANHRCDIAVGAPLNSPIKSAAPATTSSTPTVQTPATSAILNSNSAPTTVTLPGMNPPHGQAGHVCSIAVGAPLPKG